MLFRLQMVGFVTCEHPDRSFNIAWVLGGTEKNVVRDRIASLNLNPLALYARQRNANDIARPSLLAPSHQPDTEQTMWQSSQHVSPPVSPTNGVSAVLLRSRSNWSHHDGTPKPLLVFLHDGMKKENGWIRLEE